MIGGGVFLGLILVAVASRVFEAFEARRELEPIPVEQAREVNF